MGLMCSHTLSSEALAINAIRCEHLLLRLSSSAVQKHGTFPTGEGYGAQCEQIKFALVSSGLAARRRRGGTPPVKTTVAALFAPTRMGAS